MSDQRRRFVLLSAVLLAGIGGATLPPVLRAQEQAAQHTVPAAKNGGTVIALCDGKTSIEVADLKPGQTLDPARAQQVSDTLMAQWHQSHPEARWDADGRSSSGGTMPSTVAENPAQAQTQAQAGTYESFTGRDEQIWAAETRKFVDEGKAIFHDPSRLGGTVGVSCGNCHPNGANTHPETYPKYQVQLQRVALLRDMINWCIENPVKGKPLSDEDPKLRAIEAYILSTRKGVPLEYGKH